MASVNEFYFRRGFKPMAQWVLLVWKSSRVQQPYGEEVSSNCSAANENMRGSQARGGAAC
jgi:hypothetical protein